MPLFGRLRSAPKSFFDTFRNRNLKQDERGSLGLTRSEKATDTEGQFIDRFNRGNGVINSMPHRRMRDITLLRVLEEETKDTVAVHHAVNNANVIFKELPESERTETRYSSILEEQAANARKNNERMLKRGQ